MNSKATPQRWSNLIYKFDLFIPAQQGEPHSLKTIVRCYEWWFWRRCWSVPVHPWTRSRICSRRCTPSSWFSGWWRTRWWSATSSSTPDSLHLYRTSSPWRNVSRCYSPRAFRRRANFRLAPTPSPPRSSPRLVSVPPPSASHLIKMINRVINRSLTASWPRVIDHIRTGNFDRCVWAIWNVTTAQLRPRCRVRDEDNEYTWNFDFRGLKSGNKESCEYNF